MPRIIFLCFFFILKNRKFYLSWRKLKEKIDFSLQIVFSITLEKLLSFFKIYFERKNNLPFFKLYFPKNHLFYFRYLCPTFSKSKKIKTFWNKNLKKMLRTYFSSKKTLILVICPFSGFVSWKKLKNSRKLCLKTLISDRISLIFAEFLKIAVLTNFILAREKNLKYNLE